MIDINLPMIEPKLALFQVQVECVRVHATAFSEARFGITPEPFNPVDSVRGTPGQNNLEIFIRPTTLLSRAEFAFVVVNTNKP